MKSQNWRIYFFEIVWCFTLCISSIDCGNVRNDTWARSVRKSGERTGRVSLFHQLISPFQSTDSCTSSAGMVGSCLSSQDCLKRGGRGVESCAWGLGVCCVQTSSCGATSTSNVTYFTSPGYPSTWSSNSGVCSFALRPRLFSRVCQVRLDFEEFYISGPTNGVCSTDLFAVSGQDLNDIVPVICGENTGQHMYLQVGSNSGPIRFAVTTTGESEDRKWRIKITQIPCGSNAMAPAHCLQYYTGPVGKFQSFNYGNTKTGDQATYFLNMNYAVCFRKEAAMCGATFTQDGDFNVNAGGTTTANCTQDYLSFGTNRKCGSLRVGDISGIRLANSGPMTLTFVSDGVHQPSDTGFSFKYTQFSCSSGI